MRRLLLIDDDEDYASIISMRLEKEGYQVKWASSGDLAVQELEKDFGYDVIILDVEMPERNGLATLAHFRGHFNKRLGGFTIPVIVATGLMSPRLKEIFTGEQVSDYIQKPFETSMLVQKIENILAQKKS